tara:strand:- start:43144 stop:43305 length:162 start_codon:yes stop_codon:yes gene_type:complete
VVQRERHSLGVWGNMAPDWLDWHLPIFINQRFELRRFKVRYESDTAAAIYRSG